MPVQQTWRERQRRSWRTSLGIDEEKTIELSLPGSLAPHCIYTSQGRLAQQADNGVRQPLISILRLSHLQVTMFAGQLRQLAASDGDVVSNVQAVSSHIRMGFGHSDALAVDHSDTKRPSKRGPVGVRKALRLVRPLSATTLTRWDGGEARRESAVMRRVRDPCGLDLELLCQRARRVLRKEAAHRQLGAELSLASATTYWSRSPLAARYAQGSFTYLCILLFLLGARGTRGHTALT